MHYGDTTLTFLNNWYRADRRGTALTYASAVAVEEKSVIDYNRGNPDGILDPGEQPRQPRIPLVAIYPKEGTLFSDNPFFVLDAPWVSDEQKHGRRSCSRTSCSEPDEPARGAEVRLPPGQPRRRGREPDRDRQRRRPERSRRRCSRCPTPTVAGRAARQVGPAAQERTRAARARRVRLDGRPPTTADGSRPSSTSPSRPRSQRSTSSRTRTRSGCASSRPISVRQRQRRSSTSADRAQIGPQRRRCCAATIDDLSPLNGTPLYDVTGESPTTTMLDGLRPDPDQRGRAAHRRPRTRTATRTTTTDQLDGLLADAARGQRGPGQPSRCGSSRSPTAATPTSPRCDARRGDDSARSTTPATRRPSTRCSPPWCPTSDRGAPLPRSVLHPTRRPGHDLAGRDPARGWRSGRRDRGVDSASVAAAGVGALAWAGRVAFAIPRAPKREHIDPFALASRGEGSCGRRCKPKRASTARCSRPRPARCATGSRRSVSACRPA